MLNTKPVLFNYNSHISCTYEIQKTLHDRDLQNRESKSYITALQLYTNDEADDEHEKYLLYLKEDLAVELRYSEYNFKELTSIIRVLWGYLDSLVLKYETHPDGNIIMCGFPSISKNFEKLQVCNSTTEVIDKPC